MKPYLFLLIVLIFGCKEQRTVVSSNPSASIGFRDICTDISRLDGWMITFVSRAGKLAGMDSDSEISFFDSGGVSMTEYGVAPVTYSGTYSITAEGEISLQLKDYPGEWPKMILRKLDGDFLLFRSDEATGLEFGGRGGSTETSNMKPFWPFGLTELWWEREVDDESAATPRTAPSVETNRIEQAVPPNGP